MKKIVSLMIMSIFSMGLTKTLLAQQIPTITAVGGGTPTTCMSPNPADANYTATYQVNVPANISVTSLNATGDLVITAQPGTYPINGGSSGTTFTVTVQSTNNGRELSNTCDDYLLPVAPPIGNELGVNATNWGFAKGRLSVNWNTGSCNDITGLDILKSFTLHPRIIGPKCIKQGDKITFSVCNILSGRNTPTALGQDKYYWTGFSTNNYDNGFYPSGLTYLYSSADGSSITFNVDNYDFIGAKLYCRFGQCNPTTVSYIELSAITFAPTISIKDGSGNTIQPNQTGTYNYCIDGLAAFSNIQIACTPPSPPSGYDYTFDVSSNNYGWGFPSAQTLNFKSKVPWSRTANIGLIGGEIYINTTGTCDTRTDVIKIGRNLSSPTYTITGNTNLGGQFGNCIGSQGGIFTLNPNPGNVPVSWTYPSTWAPANNTPTNASSITLVPGVPTPSNAIVSASSGGCNSTVQLPVFLRPGNITQITLNGNPVISPLCIPRPPTQLNFTAVGGANAVSFNWGIPNLWTNNTGNGANTIGVTPNGTQTGNVSVTAISPSANCTSNTLGFSTVYSPTPGTITGPTCIRGGNADALSLGAALTTVNYSVSSVNGATYQWTVPLGMYVSGSLSGTITNAISFTCNGLPGSYIISVAVSSAGGCVSTSSITVNVDLRGDVLSSIINTNDQTLQLLKAGSNDPAIATYQWFRWTPPRNNISGNNQNTLTLSNAGTAGDYGVEATYTDGCKNVYAIIGTAYGNKNGYGGGLKTIKRQIKSPVNTPLSVEVTLQPNPAGNSTFLILPAEINNASVSIVSSEGRLLWKRSSLSAGKTLINTTLWTSGEYNVIIREANKKAISKKLIIQKQ